MPLQVYRSAGIFGAEGGGEAACRAFLSATSGSPCVPWPTLSIASPINVFRDGDDFAIIAEVPGVQKSDLEVQVKGRTVRISGTKSVDYPDASSAHRRERLAGRFDRALSLPFEIDADKVQTECRDGILALRLTRSEGDKPKTITVG